MPTVTITQSNYIPWRGYFDLIARSDLCVILDCVQYTRRDWRNRNIIKTSSGPQWLTIPVITKGHYDQAIDETRVAPGDWVSKHMRSITLNYRHSACFHSHAPWIFAELAKAAGQPLLTEVNEHLLRAICRQLGIETKMCRSTDLLPRHELREMAATQRLVALCRAAGARSYLSGPSAKAYLDISLLTENGITVQWMDYDCYPDYPQLWNSFMGHVSIVDLLLNVGADASRFLTRLPGSKCPPLSGGR